MKLVKRAITAMLCITMLLQATIEGFANTVYCGVDFSGIKPELVKYIQGVTADYIDLGSGDPYREETRTMYYYYNFVQNTYFDERIIDEEVPKSFEIWVQVNQEGFDISWGSSVFNGRLIKGYNDNTSGYQLIYRKRDDKTNKWDKWEFIEKDFSWETHNYKMTKNIDANETYQFAVRAFSDFGMIFDEDAVRYSNWIVSGAVKMDSLSPWVEENKWIKWNGHEDADGYQIFSKEYNLKEGKWDDYKIIGVTGKDTFYYIPYSQTGTVVQYAIRYYSKKLDNPSSFSEFYFAPISSKQVQRLESTQTKDGLNLKWDSVSGDVVYKVHVEKKIEGRDTVTDEVVATTKNNFLSVKIPRGENRRFAVKTYCKIDGKYTEVFSTQSMIGPTCSLQTEQDVLDKKYMLTVKRAKNMFGEDTINLSWNNVENSLSPLTHEAIYRVYNQKNGSWGKWKAVTSPTNKTNITQIVLSGYVYQYAVRSKTKSGKYYPYTVSKSIAVLDAPTVKATPTQNGAKVTWNKVAGANGYRVYYKKAGAKSWTLVSKTTALSYIRNLPKGEVGQFAVYAIYNYKSGGYDNSSLATSGYVKSYASVKK